MLRQALLLHQGHHMLQPRGRPRVTACPSEALGAASRARCPAAARSDYSRDRLTLDLAYRVIHAPQQTLVFRNPGADFSVTV